MALISRGEYNALDAMFNTQMFLGTSRTQGITRGTGQVWRHHDSPRELIRFVQLASAPIDLREPTTSYVPQCPVGIGRLYNLAVDELIRRYRAYGREWMKADTVETAPPEADV